MRKKKAHRLFFHEFSPAPLGVIYEDICLLFEAFIGCYFKLSGEPWFLLQDLGHLCVEVLIKILIDMRS